MKPSIIKLRYLKDGKPHGQPYTYYSKENVLVGDIVQVNDHAKGLVVDIDIPEEEIADIKHLVKYIHRRIEE